MATTLDELKQQKCVPCEGGVPVVPPAEVAAFLQELPGWQLTDNGRRIRRQWVAKDFRTAIKFVNRVSALAESEDHHPDIHLCGYRNLALELSTHAIGGLSQNDFIMAAKISEIPLELKSG